jgi:hypothetical protein
MTLEVQQGQFSPRAPAEKIRFLMVEPESAQDFRALEILLRVSLSI